MSPAVRNTDGFSEVSSEILIVILVIALAAIIFSVFSGALTPLFQKTSLVAASGAVSYVPIPDSGIALPVFDIVPIAGEPFFMAGQPGSPADSVSASFVLISPDGTSSATTLTGYSGGAGQYGKTIYIYRDSDFSYKVSDSLVNRSSRIRDIPKGIWTIRMIDNTANVILTEMTVPVQGSGFTVNPSGSTTIWTNSSNLSLTNSSGYQIPFTNNGVIPLTGPNGIPAFHFNGSGAYIRGQNNPDLQFTGDMSLSLWLNPADASGPYSGSGSNWHTIVGKGQLNGGSSETDNYQLVQMGNQIYFEWNDAVTGQHYNIVTNQIPGMQNTWNYITVTVTAGGLPVVFVNSASRPYSIYQSNTPGVNYIGSSSSPPPGYGVHLLNVGNDILIGKQNGPPGTEFYYSGDMSSVSFYNRALIQSEINDNYNNYQT